MRTASGSVLTAPSWKYGGVIATLRRLGTLKTYISASSCVTSKRPLSTSLLPVSSDLGRGNDACCCPHIHRIHPTHARQPSLRNHDRARRRDVPPIEAPFQQQ